ncbi:DUF6493 family protein [Actinoplanes sp. NPDC051851]|uniref:DUF6493 family protein n=1 Tax=Actinoplanes sp. NPDC051851 TaxID=3154753 RepID=UPI00341A2904
MSLTWDEIDHRAHHAKPARLTRELLAISEEERLALAPAIDAGIKAADPDRWWSRDGQNPNPGYALAVIACMPSAARVAAALSRRGMRGWNSTEPDHFLEIARARELTWLGDLGERLARKVPARETWGGEWPFAAAVLAAGGAEPPVTEGVVRSWINGLLRPGRREPVPPLSIRMREDPFLHLLLPAVFEIDGMGAELGGGYWDEASREWQSTPRLPAVLAHLVADGTCERKTILDATIDRLLRPDKPAVLRPFVMIHDALAPTLDECAAHALDYARMLPEAPGPIATLAQRALRTVGDAGRLELETLLEASVPVLLRTEKSLVKAQLTWLDRVARQEPERAGEVCETIAVAFGHPALDVQEKALDLVGKRVAALDPGTVERLADAAVALTGDLPARAAGLFGTSVAEPAYLPELPPPPPPAVMPAPIASAAELAEEVVTLVHEPSAVGWERVLAALVALYAAGRQADLAAALQPVLDRYPGDFEENTWNRDAVTMMLGEVIRAASGAPQHRNVTNWMQRSLRTAWQEGRRGGTDSMFSAKPDGVLAVRVAEVAIQLTASMVPMTVATPTHVTGSLDAAELLARLRRAEAEGWQPWPFDFEQALLRLPRETDPAVRAGAAALTSPAGRQFAAWIDGGGLPDPVVTRFEQASDPRKRHWETEPQRRVVAALRPARDGGLRLERQLVTLTPDAEPDNWPDDFADRAGVLAMVLPHHREFAAAWALPELAAQADEDKRDGGTLLPVIAELGGPAGPALALAVAYAFGARHDANRVAALDAFLLLAARGEPSAAATGATSFPAAAGAELGALAAAGLLKLSRAVPALTDAYRAGAAAAMWELLAAALPALLATTPRGLPDLLELATQVAGTVGARTAIPGLAGVAARPGGTRVVTEAKRLCTVLGPEAAA